ncbi:MAG: PKD domain-containing protein [Syntrophomonas sp.]
MNRLYKTTLLITLFIVSVFLPITLLFETAQANVFTNSINKLPDSSPGNFKVTWYSCKKYFPGQEPGTPHAGEIFNNLVWPAVDKDKSDAALQSWDTSNCTGQGHMSDLTFDMKNWQPDPQYWITWQDLMKEGNTLPYDTMFKSLYNWNWCEVEGYIKLSTIPSLYGYGDYIGISIVPLQRSDVKYDLVIDSNGTLPDKDMFVPFRLRISCNKPDQSQLNSKFTTVLHERWRRTLSQYSYAETDVGDIPVENLYGTLSLKDMQPYFQLDAKNYTIYLDPKYSAFPVEDYEYGYAGGTTFKTLGFGTNYLAPDSGDVIVRYKLMNDPTFGRLYSNWYITLGTVAGLAPGQLLMTSLTPTEATLAWSAPPNDNNLTVAGYDIYRRVVGKNAAFDPSILTMSSAETQVQCVGSTDELTFTDQNLMCVNIYEYFVKTRYSSGGSSLASNTVRTDSLPIPGLPYTPNNLRADFENQTATTSDLKLYWDKSLAASGIKEYVVYRKMTAAPPPKQESDSGVIIIGGVSEVAPREIGRSSSTDFIDRNLPLGYKCEYYVQAVDNNGIPSYLSRPLELTIIDTTPPTAPGDLQAGDIWRQGNSVQYAYPPESGIRNVLLGPQREVALRWQPSTDNVKLVGYDIYRSVTGKDPSNNTYWGKQNFLLGSTQDTSLIDSGLEFGATYTYVVVAKDANNNKSTSTICIGTEKSPLTDLVITNGSQSLTLEPVFAYYQTEYNLNVENAVKTINLKAVKMDSLARVTVNGNPVGDKGSIGPLALDPGKNVFKIEVVPRKGAEWFIEPETTTYTLTVNRANLDNLPVLTLPDNEALLNEGDTYKSTGRLDNLNNLGWTGLADYGDGSGEKHLQLKADGSFSLEHKYLDNGQYQIKVSFRYQDLGLVTGNLEVTVENVPPALAGVKNEYITNEGSLLTITGNIIDPGHDARKVSGDYGSEWGPISAVVNADNTFTLQETFYDQQPVYDMLLTVVDDDGASFSIPLKIKVENVAPSVQASGPALVQVGFAYTGSGLFTDPGLDKWQATVDYGDTSGPQPLTLKEGKTFKLTHMYLKPGPYTITIQVQDQDGGLGSFTLPVKIKECLFTLEAGDNATLNEGDKLERNVQVRGRTDKIKGITVDYGDGAGEETAALSINYPGKPLIKTPPVDVREAEVSVSSANSRLIGWVPLQHIYKDNGTYTIKTRLIDVDGDSYEGSFQADVKNAAPSIQLEPIPDMYAGTTFTCTGTVTDPGNDTFTVEINYKDGSAPDKINVDSDNSFSFSHTYSTSGYYNIEAIVWDDDGEMGWNSRPVKVIIQSSGSGSSIVDATLHSFAAGFPLVLNPAFNPGCLNYTAAHPAMNIFNITITVASGATVKYTNGGATQILAIDPATCSATFQVDLLGDLTIEVTAADTVTIQTYSFDAT